MKIELDAMETLEYAKESAYWDGFADGATAAAGHAKQKWIHSTIEKKRAAEAKPFPLANKEA